jgi:hypothetical protein
VNFPFNVALGRIVELYNRVNSNDPTNSALIVLVLAAAGLETDEVLRAKTSFSDLVSGATNEVTNTDYARITLTDAELAAYTVDDSARAITLVIPLLTWSSNSGPDAGDSWSKLVIGYDPDTTGGTDSSIIPLTAHDLRYQGSVLVPNNSPINVDLTSGFVIARPRR